MGDSLPIINAQQAIPLRYQEQPLVPPQFAHLWQLPLRTISDSQVIQRGAAHRQPHSCREGIANTGECNMRAEAWFVSKLGQMAHQKKWNEPES
jgi:hypothetical protein